VVPVVQGKKQATPAHNQPTPQSWLDMQKSTAQYWCFEFPQESPDGHALYSHDRKQAPDGADTAPMASQLPARKSLLVVRWPLAPLSSLLQAIAVPNTAASIATLAASTIALLPICVLSRVAGRSPFRAFS
jgi:hypothetical protein